LLEKGAIDMVVDRRKLKETLIRLLEYTRRREHSGERLVVSS
jgi:acetyl-CoA carboxylase beta subunit